MDEYRQLSLIRLIGENCKARMSILHILQVTSKIKWINAWRDHWVRPLQVVVLGAGIMGEFATKAAIGLVASVKGFDNSLSKLKKITLPL